MVLTAWARVTYPESSLQHLKQSLKIMNTSPDTHSSLHRLQRSAARLLLPALLASGLITATAGTQVPYFGIVKGTNTVVAVPPSGPMSCQNEAVEFSNLGGKGTQTSMFTMQVLRVSATVIKVVADGTTIAVAANGDLTYIEFHLEELTLADASKIKCPVPYGGTFKVTGGTGRFDGAAGRGRIAGLDYGSGRMVHTFEGTISYGGSRRK